MSAANGTFHRPFGTFRPFAKSAESSRCTVSDEQAPSPSYDASRHRELWHRYCAGFESDAALGKLSHSTQTGGHVLTVGDVGHPEIERGLFLPCSLINSANQALAVVGDDYRFCRCARERDV